jgi:hypothetical protein
MKVAAESLIAQINSQCKLATLRRENQKIRYENKILKANKLAPEGVATFKIYLLIPEKHPSKSRETIPLIFKNVCSQEPSCWPQKIVNVNKKLLKFVLKIRFVLPVLRMTRIVVGAILPRFLPYGFNRYRRCCRNGAGSAS